MLQIKWVRVMVVGQANMSFPLVGNRLENKERFRTSRNDKITNPQS